MDKEAIDEVRRVDEEQTKKNDKGHRLLMSDLKDIYDSANDFEFHDFKNNRYATPKIELRKKLIAMSMAVVDGLYDN